jgi:TPR repeat protein
LDGASHGHVQSLNALTRLAYKFPEAYYCLGIAHEKLNMWPEAIDYYKKLATAASFYRVGVIYSKDRYHDKKLIIKKSIDEEVYWTHQAAKLFSAGALCSLFELSKQHHLAMFVLGSMYELGQGLPRKFDEALNYYKRSDEAGNKDAAYRLGELEPNHAQKYRFFIRAKELGHDQVLRLIESLLETMADVDLFSLTSSPEVSAQKAKRASLDNRQALESLFKDAEQDPYCAYIIGQFFENGTCVPKSLQSAFSYYCKAAVKGHQLAMQALLGFAERGHPDAQYRLGADYFFPMKNRLEAVQWCMLSAQQGQKDAKSFLFSVSLSAEENFRVAELYEKGVWVRKDFESALHFYGKATEQGHTKAAYHKAQLTHLFPGEAYRNESWEYYLEAANHGMKDSLAPLERLAESGDGSKKIKMAQVYRLPFFYDLEKITSWLDKAKDYGHPLATPMLESITKEHASSTKILVFSKQPKEHTHPKPNLNNSNNQKRDFS